MFWFYVRTTQLSFLLRGATLLYLQTFLKHKAKLTSLVNAYLLIAKEELLNDVYKIYVAGNIKKKFKDSRIENSTFVTY